MPITRRHVLASAGLSLGLSRLPALAEDRPVQIDIVEAGVRLRPEGPDTRLLRYINPTPVATLRAKQGVETVWRLHNSLAVPTTFQLCGLRGLGQLGEAGASSSVAIAPGRESLVRFTPPDSGTAWIRPRLDPDSQAARGLAAVLIVDPAGPAPAIDADLVCLVTDHVLDAGGQLADPAVPPGADAKPMIVLNDAAIPSAMDVRPGSRVRLRLVNGSMRRVTAVACEGAKPMIVAVDGQPSELFEPIRDTVPIGPGARFDLVLDLPRDPGKSVRLVLRGTERVGGVLEPDRVLSMFTTAGLAVDAKPLIAALPPNSLLPPQIPLERAKRAELTLDVRNGTWTVNGVPGRDWPPQPVLRVRRGDAVTLGFANASKDLVALSLYGQALRLLHPNDDGWEPYWRDTVLLPPGSRNHVAFVADTPGRWPIESGFLAQAVAGLRCWFEVS